MAIATRRVEEARVEIESFGATDIDHTTTIMAGGVVMGMSNTDEAAMVMVMVMVMVATMGVATIMDIMAEDNTNNTNNNNNKISMVIINSTNCLTSDDNNNNNSQISTSNNKTNITSNSNSIITRDLQSTIDGCTNEYVEYYSDGKRTTQ